MATSRRRRPSSTLADIQGPRGKPRGVLLGNLPNRTERIYPKRFVPDKEPLDLSALPKTVAAAVRAYYESEDANYLDQLDAETDRLREKFSSPEATALNLATDLAERSAQLGSELQDPDAPITNTGTGRFKGPATAIPLAEPPEKTKRLKTLINLLVRREQIPPYANPATTQAAALALAKQAGSELERILNGLTPQVTQWEFGGEAGRGRPAFNADDSIKAAHAVVLERYPILSKGHPAYSRAAEGAYFHILDRLQSRWKTTQVAPGLAESFRTNYTDKILKPTVEGYFASVLDPANTSSQPSVTLDPLQERAFQNWYATFAKKTGQSVNPDDPTHQHSYRAAFVAGVGPKRLNGRWVWPEEFRKLNQPKQQQLSTAENQDGKTADQVATTQALIDLRDQDRDAFPGDIDVAFTAMFASVLRGIAGDRNLNRLEKRTRLEQAMEIMEDFTVGGGNIKLGDTLAQVGGQPGRGEELERLYTGLVARIEGGDGAGRGIGFYDDLAGSLLSPIFEKLQENLGDEQVVNDAQGILDAGKAVAEALEVHIGENAELSSEDRVGLRAAGKRLFARQGEFAHMTTSSAAAMNSIKMISMLGDPDEAERMGRLMGTQGWLALPHWMEVQKQIAIDREAKQFTRPESPYGLATSASDNLLTSFAEIPLKGVTSRDIQARYQRERAAFAAAYKEAARAGEGTDEGGQAAANKWIDNQGRAWLERIEKPLRETIEMSDQVIEKYRQAASDGKSLAQGDKDIIRQFLPSSRAEGLIRESDRLTGTNAVRTRNAEALRRTQEDIQVELVQSLDFVREAMEDSEGLGKRMTELVSHRVNRIFNSLVTKGIAKLSKDGFTQAEFDTMVEESRAAAIKRAHEIYVKQKAGDKTIRDLVIAQADADTWRQSTKVEDEEVGYFAQSIQSFHPQLSKIIEEQGLSDSLSGWMRVRRVRGTGRFLDPNFTLFGFTISEVKTNAYLKHNMPEAEVAIDQGIEEASKTLTKDQSTQLNYAKWALLGRLEPGSILKRTEKAKGDLFSKGVGDYLIDKALFFKSRAALDRFEKDTEYAYRFLQHVGFRGIDTEKPLRQNLIVREWLEHQIDLLEQAGRK